MHPIRTAIKAHAADQKAKLAGLLMAQAMTRRVDVEEAIRVMDCLLNVTRADLDAMMVVARDIAACRREMQGGRWS